MIMMLMVVNGGGGLGGKDSNEDKGNDATLYIINLSDLIHLFIPAFLVFEAQLYVA